jgi:hypothetical protein
MEDNQLQSGVHQQRSLVTPTGSAPGYRLRSVKSLPAGGQKNDVVWNESSQSICVFNGINWVCGSSCYNYIVDSGGGGTHLTLFGPSGALAAAWSNPANPDFVSIQVCHSHYELVTETFQYATFPTFYSLTIEGSAQTDLEANYYLPIFDLDTGVTSFINRTYPGTSPFVDSVVFRNLMFKSSFNDIDTSLFSGLLPISADVQMFNCSLLYLDYMFNVERMIRSGSIVIDNCFLAGWNPGSALIRQTVSGTFGGFLPRVYQAGVFITNSAIQEYSTLIAGVGCSFDFLSNIVIEGCRLLLSDLIIDNRPFVDLSIGGAYNFSVGTYPSAMYYNPRIRITDNTIEWAAYQNISTPFLSSNTVAGSLLISSLVCLGNTVNISRSNLAPDDVYFADMDGSAGPDNVIIMGNSISLYGSTGVGTAIRLGPNARNCRVDNVYRGFGSAIPFVDATGGTSGAGSGGAGADPAVVATLKAEPFVTIGNPSTLGQERALTPGIGITLVDGGPNGLVTLASQPTAGPGIVVTPGGAGSPVTIGSSGYIGYAYVDFGTELVSVAP